MSLKDSYLKKHREFTDKIKEFEDFAYDCGSMNFYHYYKSIQKIGKKTLDFPENRDDLSVRDTLYIMAYEEKMTKVLDKALTFFKKEQAQYITGGNQPDKKAMEKFYKGVYQQFKQDVLKIREGSLWL